MALEVTYRYGDAQMIDYTPVSAVVAGEVVVVGEIPCVCHTAIPAGQLGALSMGGGIYKGIAAGAITAGAKVYWDNAANKVTTTSSGNKVLGWCAPHSSANANNDPVEFIHNPAA